MAFIDYEFCVIKLSFGSLKTARDCIDMLMKNKLFAHATISSICNYGLKMTADESSLDEYLVDENIIGITSVDQEDDYLMEVYTSKRLEGKVKKLIDDNFSDSFDFYTVIPISDASRKLRLILSKLNIYHLSMSDAVNGE